jgi:hypothetical protein
MQNVLKGERSMSIWDDATGRKHVGVMACGKRVHSVLPEGATTRMCKWTRSARDQLSQPVQKKGELHQQITRAKKSRQSKVSALF